MRFRPTTLAVLAALAACATLPAMADTPAPRKTKVTIDGDRFLINGEPTYKGRLWRGRRVAGLLLNARLVQATFDDLNPETRSRWAYPDTGRWDAERNVREFLAAMPEWRRRGLLSFTLNLQGGSPEGYSREQPWHNSAIASDGSLRPEYMERLRRILDLADELGMVPIVGLFYFGQDQRLAGEAAVLRATDNATRWLLAGGWQNVLVEVNNECDQSYDHAILKPARVHELIERVKAQRDGERRLLVATSYGGGAIPGENVVRASDFLLLHGNGVADPERIAAMVRETRALPGYTPKPILFNEDDHFDFDKPLNNFVAALSEYAGWGYFDSRKPGDDFDSGFQNVPVNWGLSSERKRGFFRLLAEVTGADLGVLGHEMRMAEEIALWPGAAPGSEKLGIEEALTERSQDPRRPDRIYTRITRPTLRVFAPPRPNGAAVIVAPGGAYQRVVADKEGVDICQWLNGLGVTAFLLKYRLPDEGHENGRDVPLMDAQRAIRLVRSQAARWGVDPTRVGIIGFSAGGHLAGTLATFYSRPAYAPRDAADALSARPDFAILGYPVVGRTPRPEDPTPPPPRIALMAEYRVESAVTKDTPPMFLFHADDDSSVPASGSARVYLALREAGVPAELHIFRRGGHGFGIRDAAGPIALWPQLCGDWMKTMGILK